MLEEQDRQTLDKIREADVEERPTWKDHSYCFVLIVGGLTLYCLDLFTGWRPGAAGGLLAGMGLGMLLLAWPLTRHCWRCYRLIQHADEKGAFKEGG